MTHIMDAMLSRRRSAVVLVERDRVALIRRTRQGHTYYMFPGGGVELGETDEEAAVREAREELGVDVQAPPWPVVAVLLVPALAKVCSRPTSPPHQLGRTKQLAPGALLA